MGLLPWQQNLPKSDFPVLRSDGTSSKGKSRFFFALVTFASFLVKLLGRQIFLLVQEFLFKVSLLQLRGALRHCATDPSRLDRTYIVEIEEEAFSDAMALVREEESGKHL